MNKPSWIVVATVGALIISAGSGRAEVQYRQEGRLIPGGMASADSALALIYLRPGKVLGGAFIPPPPQGFEPSNGFLVTAVELASGKELFSRLALGVPVGITGHSLITLKIMEQSKSSSAPGWWGTESSLVACVFDQSGKQILQSKPLWSKTYPGSAPSLALRGSAGKEDGKLLVQFQVVPWGMGYAPGGNVIAGAAAIDFTSGAVAPLIGITFGAANKANDSPGVEIADSKSGRRFSVSGHDLDPKTIDATVLGERIVSEEQEITGTYPAETTSTWTIQISDCKSGKVLWQQPVSSITSTLAP